MSPSQSDEFQFLVRLTGTYVNSGRAKADDVARLCQAVQRTFRRYARLVFGYTPSARLSASLSRLLDLDFVAFERGSLKISFEPSQDSPLHPDDETVRETVRRLLSDLQQLASHRVEPGEILEALTPLGDLRRLFAHGIDRIEFSVVGIRTEHLPSVSLNEESLRELLNTRGAERRRVYEPGVAYAPTTLPPPLRSMSDPFERARPVNLSTIFGGSPDDRSAAEILNDLRTSRRPRTD